MKGTRLRQRQTPTTELEWILRSHHQGGFVRIRNRHPSPEGSRIRAGVGGAVLPTSDSPPAPVLLLLRVPGVTDDHVGLQSLHLLQQPSYSGRILLFPQPGKGARKGPPYSGNLLLMPLPSPALPDTPPKGLKSLIALLQTDSAFFLE